jgi:hypothetical protein
LIGEWERYRILSLSPQTTRSFFAGTVQEFLASDPEQLIGRLSGRLAELHRSADRDQIRAWARQIEILTAAFNDLGEVTRDWSVLFETPLLRLGRRLDVVVLMPGMVVVLEFKINATAYKGADIAQTEFYALSLRDFHAASQDRIIVPILCADLAKSSTLNTEPVMTGVAQTVLVNAQDLAEGLRRASQVAGGSRDPLTAQAFEYSPYRPTPTIIEAARALYAGHSVADLGRGDAAADDLARSSKQLTDIVLDAQANRVRTICFVTGTPGAGKTLLGLDIALKSRVAGGGMPPASLLSGNPPLVHVLVEALAHDAHLHRGLKKPDARREAGSAVQGLLGFLREHDEGPPPPENVLVFDEAQRAWDAEVGKKLLGRERSEPALFLDIMARADWACLICLVGPGQEINRGEGGLPLWGEALLEAAQTNKPWRVFAAPQAIGGGPDVGSAGLFSGGAPEGLQVDPEPQLHLANAMRSYRNPNQVRWVSALLNGEVSAAADLARAMAEPPALVSRDLGEVKAWLKERRRGGRSTGLLTSSGAVRLVAEGLPPAPRSNELDAIAHWFLKPFHDYRSSGALETPLSEFGCQGLELDYVALCWGGDLIWRNRWVGRTMAAPRWREVAKTERQQHRINGYRVLLTRARAGAVIYVPVGDEEDDTRRPAEFDAIADVLIAAGCRRLSERGNMS